MRYNWNTELPDRAFMQVGGRVTLEGGGSSAPAPVQQTNTASTIPPELMPYASGLMARTEAVSDINQNPYQQYQGQRTADFNPLQRQAFNNIQNMQVSQAIGAGMTLAGRSAGLANDATSFYNQGANLGLGATSLYDQGARVTGDASALATQALQQYRGAGLGALGAQGQYTGQATDPSQMKQWMSPYMQNSVDWQKQQAVNDYGRSLPGMGANAAKSGAFGGNRDAIATSEAGRGLQNTLAGIQATGTQNAYQQAQQAQQYAAGLGMQGYGHAINAAQGVNQTAAGLNQSAQNLIQAGQGYNQSGQLMGQMGQGYNQSAQNVNQAGQSLGQLGMQNYQQEQGINQAQQLAGGQQQALAQQNLSQQYQDFLNQQNYPYKQLGFQSDILHGVPTTQSAQTVYAQPPSMLSQTSGLLGGIGSLVGAYSASQPKGTTP